MFRFEKLDVWHRAIQFTGRIYGTTREFPSDERFGLTSQFRRAAVSISSNSAEGSSRRSETDFARFLEIAYGSLMEVVSQLHIEKRQGFIPEGVHTELYEESEQLARMLSGLKASLSQSNRASQEGR